MSKLSGADAGQRPWYDSAFERDYLLLYAHRDETAAQGEADFIMANSGPAARGRILDIACGAGRHLIWLSQNAELAVGLDRSEELLGQAKSRLGEAGAPAMLLCADMRELPFEAEFTCVTLLFTSFGYFATDRENLTVIRQGSKVLKAGGVFWLDYMNEPQVRRTLEPYSRQSDGKLLIEQRRRITEEGRVEKHIRIVSQSGQRCWSESVKLYRPEQVEEMFAHCGLSIEGVWGDFEGHKQDSDSPRLIIMGRKDG